MSEAGGTAGRPGGAVRWGLSIAAGVALGVLASWADWYAGRPPFSDFSRGLAVVVNTGSVWACVGILAGWLVADLRASWLAGVIALAAAVVGYYAYGNLAGDRLGFGLSTLSGVLNFWLFAAAILGPVLGTIGALARRRDRWGLVARLVPTVGVCAELAAIHGIGRAGDVGGNVATVGMLVVALGWGVAVLVRARGAAR